MVHVVSRYLQLDMLLIQYMASWGWPMMLLTSLYIYQLALAHGSYMYKSAVPYERRIHSMSVYICFMIINNHASA